MQLQLCRLQVIGSTLCTDLTSVTFQFACYSSVYLFYEFAFLSSHICCYFMRNCDQMLHGWQKQQKNLLIRLHSLTIKILSYKCYIKTVIYIWPLYFCHILTAFYVTDSYLLSYVYWVCDNFSLKNTWWQWWWQMSVKLVL